MNISSARSDYIILANNNINEKNIGTNLYIKTKIISLDNNIDYDVSWLNILQNVNNNYKNRIILCVKIDNISTSNACLITKNNIKNNMKFIFDSSNNNNGKILFVKNLQPSDNSLNHLFNDLKNVFFENNKSNNIDSSKNTINKRYIYHFNYYFSNSDIYKINIKEYLYKYFREISNNLVSLSNGISQDICYNTIGYTITNSFNDFSFINTTIDSSSVINFKDTNFNKLLIDNSNSSYFSTSNDTSLNLLVIRTNYSVYRNIWSYNKLTLDYKHVNYYDISINNDFDRTTRRRTPRDFSYIELPNTIIKTFLIKTNNISMLQNSKNNSKIIFDSKNIYLNNLKVLDNNSNLYNKQLHINNISGTLIDASNIIFLGLGNQLTGITQHHIYNHVHFSHNSNQKLTITIKKNINTTNINTNSKFASLIPSLNNYYLLDISLNYSASNNISHNINNTIKYNNILYNNNIQSQVGKVFDLNITRFFNALTNNYFTNSFNTLATLNNTHNLYSLSNVLVNKSINFKFKNIIKVPSSIRLVNQTTLLTRQIPITSENGYDLRFNYDSYFFLSNNLDILLTREFINLRNNSYLDYYEYSTSLLNFYSLTINNLVQTVGAGDYTDIECIYIYHDPDSEGTDPKFKYPNNNIEIKFDTSIDTLNNAIEQYRSLEERTTSNTNAVFIPTKNGSNISKKMIQGLIGLNNVPKLLSIKPYDSNSIVGRGFINQYQISDTCITSNCDQIAVKQNAIKHESVKNNRMNSSNSLKRQEFANIVKSNVRNKFSQECINNAVTTNNVVTIGRIPDPTCIKIRKYTPFVMFEKGKGKYL